ncbi:hypothetical protein HCN44_011480 [Aphidius gifuensis]|uniref:Rootletin-like coiled-coil domain-containing protein n=1 Tax=Aphidius gifuensis TaxID=684658 RepID=A0A834XKU1_APHGI|nr:rootletin-like isoform X1 [Aphidius gifuensis]KAF7987174.1 hypothetical protein HCN44_011480 [Aphidius gifuensis]
MPRALPKTPLHLIRSQMKRRRPPFLRGSKQFEPRVIGVRMTEPSTSHHDNTGIDNQLDSGGDDDDVSSDLLVRQNMELRNRLKDEAENYKRRLGTYRQAQQHQAVLVSRLQAKVLQYKQRCNELENQMTESLPIELTRNTSPSTSVLEAAHQTLRDIRDEQIHDLDTAIRKLNDERRKTEKLIEINTALKNQLEESHRTNESLTNDLQKLSNDWDILREEMNAKEDEWKEEEIAFNEYYTSEHYRLLNLWRNVVSLKRTFTDMKTTTERDLNKFNNKLTTTTNDMTSVCSGVKLALQVQQSQAVQPSITQQYQTNQDNDLKVELVNLRQQHEVTMNDVKMKDERINQLIREINKLEERCGEAENNIIQATKIQEDVKILESALRDIAHAVIQDAEIRDNENIQQQTPHVHLSQSTTIISQRSPKRNNNNSRNNTIPAFAESTISAVQASLHKYQLTIHELQLKLQNSREQLNITKKQCDNAEVNVQLLEERTSELIVQLDTTRSQNIQLVQERNMLQKNFDTIKTDKNILEKNKIDMNHMIEELNNNYEKLEKINNKLQKLCSSLEDEKIYLQDELSKMTKDNEIREINFKSEEERSSRMREELLTLRDELSRIYLTKDMLEAQKIETDNVISQIEKSKNDIEIELERVIIEKSDIQDEIIKLETINENNEKDKQRLADNLKILEDEKLKLTNQCSDQLGDIGSLRKELLQAEQIRLDLESDKVTLNEKIKFLEIEKEKIEIELGQIIRERGNLSNQLSILSNKKDLLNEELMRTRQRLEQSNEMNARINRNLEDLVKDNEEKQVLIETNDKEYQRMKELLASMKSEKETLEGVLFDAQTNLESIHSKKIQIEQEQKDLLIKQETLKGQISRLTTNLNNSEKINQEIKQSLTQQKTNQEIEYQNIIVNLKKQNDDNLKKLNDEKEQIKVTLEKRIQQTITTFENQKEDEINQLQMRIEELQQHIDNICQQHEESLLRAENDKQQALLIAHHDQQALVEKLENIYRELEETKNDLERLRRDSNSRIEQDRSSINQLRDELNRYKTKLEETKLHYDEEKMNLELKINDITKEKELTQKDYEEIKIQLHVTEDKIDTLQNQLQETIRKLKDTENSNETYRKEIVDVKRQLTDTNYAVDKYCNTNKELREHVKRIESDKREQSRTLEESFQKITSLEDNKTILENEKSRLQNQLRDMEHELIQIQQQLRFTQDELQKCQSTNSQAQNEERELQARLSNEIEERERLQLQLHQLKKQVVDLDNSLEVTRQEFGRLRQRADEEDERWRGREQELLVRIEDSRCKERKLEDQKHNLEVCLADASQQLQELKARLGGSEGRVRALDIQLSQLELSKKEVEQKLSSVGTTLRRIAGIQLDGTVNIPFKLTSPSRKWSPVRGGHKEQHNDINVRDVIIDVDPEAIRKGIRSLMQQVAQIERERDDAIVEITNIKKQLVEVQDHQIKTDTKTNHINTMLRNIQDEKAILETKLSQKNSLYQTQQDLLNQKIQETEQLREKITTLELMISNETEEKGQFEDKFDKMRVALNRLENEKRGLQEDLGRSDARSTKLELQRMSLEGDLQRLQMVLQEKDGNLQKLHERLDGQQRTSTNLEERCSSLKSTIEQLNIALEKASTSETELKSEIANLRRSLMEQNALSHGNNEKIKHLQKQLSNVENERRILTERLDNVQQNIMELKHTNQSLTDHNTRLQADLANNEIQRSGLESQLRLSNWPQEGISNKEEEIVRQLNNAQRDRSEMRSKVDALNDKVRQLECDKRNLERQLSSARANCGRSKSYERPEKAHIELMGTSVSIDILEQENRDLRMKIRRLETILAEKESEIVKLITINTQSHSTIDSSREHRIAEIERLRGAQLQAEKLLEAREQSHRQQILRLENQIKLLREQLNQEIKRRQMYVLKSSRAGREMQHLRQALGDSLRTVSQDPSVDAILLEHEARKLDTTVNSSSSLPPTLALPPPSSSSYDRRSPLLSPLK